MTTTLKGLSSSTVVPVGATLRLSFGKGHMWVDDAAFAPKFNDLYNRLPERTGLFTVTQSGVMPGQDTSAVNVRNHRERTAGQIVTEVESLAGYYLDLVVMELLTGTAAVEANKPAGAADLDAAAKRAADVQNADNPVSKFYAALTDVAKKVFILVVIVACLAGLVYAGKIRNMLRG
jgi:hypothetical protein